MTISPLLELVRLHKAIGHPMRLRLLGMLRSGGLCVCQMTAVARLASSTVSEHLAELRRAGLLAEEKRGRWVCYRLSGAPRARRALAGLWKDLERDPRAQADSVLLGELRHIPVEALCEAGLDLRRLGSRSVLNAVRRAEAFLTAEQGPS